MRERGNAKKPRRRSGFSLLELLAVMSIMALLSTVAVTGYFNAVRGMARRSAVKHMVNTLVLARQRACLDGSRVSVMLFNDNPLGETGKDAKVIPSYVVCKEIGTVTGVSGNFIWDEFESLGKLFNVPGASMSGSGSSTLSMRLYNMSVGGWWEVYPWVKEDYKVTGRESAYSYARGDALKSFDLPVYSFERNTHVDKGSGNEAQWRVGHTYGIEAAPINSLPRGIQFDRLKDDPRAQAISITFEPDGTAFGQTMSIRLRERNPPNKSLTVTVSQTDGTIKYSEQWK